MCDGLSVRVVRAEDAAKDILRAMYLGREMVAPGLFTKLNLHIVSKLLPPSVYSASVQVRGVVYGVTHCTGLIVVSWCGGGVVDV